MRFLKNNIWTLAAIAFVFALSFIGDASAQVVDGSSVMETAQSKAIQLFESAKTIVFVVGGFGLIGMAFGAIFGKVKWVWFASLAFGLAVLAAAGAIVEYATGDSDFKSANGSAFDDSFGNDQ